MKKIKKVLLMSEFTPPVLEGIAIMLYNLFSFFPLDSVCLFTDDPSKRKSKQDEKLRLTFKHYVFRVPNFSFAFLRSSNARAFLQYCWLPFIIMRGIWIVAKEKSDAIFGINSRGPYLIAAYYLHCITRRPLYVYMFDLWSKSIINPTQRKCAQMYEKRILQSAKKVFVMSENLAEYYKNRYLVDAEVIYHSYRKCDIENTVRASDNHSEETSFDIVFTGVVETETLWLRLMRKVLRELEGENIKLKLFVLHVDSVKVDGNNISVQSLNREDVFRAQRHASVLFLPMYIKDEFVEELVQTASPSKLGEYLISGVPILVFAPTRSYISEYAIKGDWALVVNGFDKDALKNAIMQLKSNVQLRNKLVANALKAAINHDAESMSKKLQRFIFEH